MCTPRRPYALASSALLAALLLAPPALAQEAAGLPAAAPPPGARGVEVLRAAEPPRAPEPPRPAPPPAQAPAPTTDFQAYAGTSVGGLLPIFGQELFAAPPSTFAPVDDLPASPDYVLGAGDEVLVRGWGQVEIDVRATVSREGTIHLPRVGQVAVAGVPFRLLEARLRAAVGRYFKGFELSASLGRLRSIQVFVVGHARKPGLYTVGSLSTLMNALFASGGPAPTGSLRRLELRRGDRLVGEFDLYDLVLQGDKSKDLRLQAGDVIFIPPVGPQVAIAGRVKTPAIFELRGPGTTLADLVAFAGGLTTTADAHSVQLERLDQERGRVVVELPWGPASLATALRDGDVVRLRGLSQKFANAVTLRGNVAFPIRTEWRPGLTVSGLIPDRGVLVPERYWERVAARGNAAPRQREGQRAEASARATEAGSAPLKTEVENLVEEVNWDYAVVERLDRARLEPVLLPFNLRKAVVERDPAHDLALEAGDVVTVFSQRDVLSPAERRTAFVRVEGEVATPGFYQVRPGETVRQLVERAGGLARGAYLFGAEFTRESVRREQQARLEQVAARAEQELEFAATERLSRAATAEEAAATRAQLETQRATLARLRTLKASGRMVLEVPPGAGAVGDLPALALEDGDRLYVPQRGSTVGVYGAVYHQATFLHSPGKRLRDYLGQAGGPTRSADADSTYVLRADGSVVSRRQARWYQSFGGTELMPSDALVVPEDYAPVSWVRELKDWSQIFYQFGLGVAALTILRP
ncbi:MAG: SLBB domain-containing protein [Anaeromyxobacter sp.]|nr:SLBB domain-containing protein [Anaeromyxobacter sp.]MBL0276533.1 SLBB domain-containing protein [Anaeromyxobacter sp.]